MPGPKNATRPISAASSALVEVLGEAADDTQMPDPRQFQRPTIRTSKVLGETVREEEWAWTKTTLSKFLAACPKMTVLIPLDPNNDGDDPKKARPAVVRIDGIPIEIPKGLSVRVPRPVGEIVAQSQQKFRTAQSQGLDLYTIKADATGDAALGAYQGQMSDVDDVPASAWRE